MKLLLVLRILCFIAGIANAAYAVKMFASGYPLVSVMNAGAAAYCLIVSTRH